MGLRTRKFATAFMALAVIFITSLIFHATQGYSKNLYNGKRFFDNQQFLMALPHFISAANSKPNSKETIQHLALTFEKLDRKDGVLKNLQRLLQLGHDDFDTIKWLADTYYAMDDFEMAEQAYQKLLSNKNDPAVKMKLAEVLAWQKKYDQAVIILEELNSPESKDYKTEELLANIYSWNSDYDSAIQIYSELLHKTNNRDMMVKLADCLRYAKRDEEAVKWYRKYLANIK